jgi:hypothetical protein
MVFVVFRGTCLDHFFAERTKVVRRAWSGRWDFRRTLKNGRSTLLFLAWQGRSCAPFSFLPGTLAPLTSHITAQLSLLPDKVLVVVSAEVQRLPVSSYSLKAIDVQLSCEGFVLGLSEVSWHNVDREILELEDTESSSVWLPRNNIFCAFVGCVL